MFLYNALLKAHERRQILVSVKNGKVYVGTLRLVLNPAFPITSIGILLRNSGHREKNTQRVKIDIDYFQALIQRRLEKALTENPNMSDNELIKHVYSGIREEFEERAKNYQIIIPLTEMQSVNFIDEDVHNDYDRHFASTTAATVQVNNPPPGTPKQ